MPDGIIGITIDIGTIRKAQERRVSRMLEDTEVRELMVKSISDMASAITKMLSGLIIPDEKTEEDDS